MKRSTLETIVLIGGLIIIGISLFFIFTKGDDPNAATYTNFIFAAGFLMYIGYAWMTTNSLNKEIRGLNNHVTSLKQELKKKENAIAEKDKSIQSLTQEKQSLSKDLETAQASIKKLEGEISELNTRLTDAGS